MSVAAVVPAAGSGTRLGGRVRKPFVRLAGRPLLAHALSVLQASRAIRWIQIVAQPSDFGSVNRLVRRFRITKALPPCSGGRCRSESVARGMAHLPSSAEWILVHDGARPCLTSALVSKAVKAARRSGAVACGLPAFLTVKDADAAGRVRQTLDRRRLWFVQTPQVVRRRWLQDASRRFARTLERFPDDAALLEAAGFPVRMILGDPLNLKVTTREDLMLAAAILKQRGQA